MAKPKKPSFDDRLDACSTDVEAIAILNERHFMIRVGNKNVVADVRPQEEPDRSVVLFTHEEFKKRYLAYTQWGRDLGSLYLRSKTHRQFDGTLVFKPDGSSPSARSADYNLWKGFSVEPKQGDWSRFRRHLYNNVCSRNTQWLRYLLNYFADMVQRPGRLPGVAIVLQGEKGVGKTCVYNYLARMFRRPNTVLVSGAEDLTGSFNAHLSEKVLVCADEAFFAGDPRMVGKLQSMITAEQWLLQPKGIDRYAVDNCMHLLIISNHDWVVQASKQERRYFVLKVGTRRQQDLAYFDAITQQMQSGGTAAMLYDLQERNLTGFNPMQFPSTPFLEDQKELSRPPHEIWWKEQLTEASARTWEMNTRDKTQLHGDYTDWMRRMGRGRPLTLEQLSKYFYDLHGAAVRGRERIAGRQQYVYHFPDLATCREQFEPAWKATS